tara:strand:- start:4 stop:546 length:543 start_codon:yes stop_codon:yes gene_type:complete
MNNNIFLNPEKSLKQLERVVTSNNLLNSIINTRTDKYNPDVVNNFNKLLDKRKHDKYTISNNPYKTIIDDSNKQINSEKDMVIDIRQSNYNLLLELDKIIESRKSNIKNNNNKTTKEFFEKKNRNINKISSDLSEDIKDHDNLKNNSNEYFLKKNISLEEDKKKYNDIIESLLNEGLLDS